MLNINGKVKVTNLVKVTDKMYSGTLYYSVKKDDEWEQTFIKSVFVGEAFKYLDRKKVENKTEIYVKSGILRQKNFNKLTTLEAVVFEVEPVYEKNGWSLIAPTYKKRV